MVPVEEVLIIDINSTLLALAAFIARFNITASVRIKIKFCLLCELVYVRMASLTLRKDSTARHNILDITMEWIQDTSVSPSSAVLSYNG